LLKFNRKLLWAINAQILKLRGLEIGSSVYIGPTLFLSDLSKIKIGNKVRIWPGLRIETYNGAIVTIEDDVALGPYCHITAAEDITIRASSVFVGWNTVTNITHTLDCLELHPLKRPWHTSSVNLGELLFVGQGARILPGTSLGSSSAVGANAVVTNLNAPPKSVVAGIPARVIRIN
jgi:acetyltransferase-like isoleucine patch superfamily enzyme